MNARALIIIAAAMALGFAHAPLQAQDGKDMVAAFIDENAGSYSSIAQEIWDLAELGYLETESSGLLAGMLEAAGFEVEMGVAGIPTAFVASYRNGEGPVVEKKKKKG
ncbi:MAG: hypothetical protein OXI12_00340 [Gammaproteobacteria bacterium]|nr:hypothetical protein [Gammaproteobacteria bacterium]